MNQQVQVSDTTMLIQDIQVVPKIKRNSIGILFSKHYLS
ncbi:MAG: hypothetical protein JWQ09_2069 [Segetibacter sp.]|nr:hypothetical protein [Segetibacter sp.]